MAEKARKAVSRNHFQAFASADGLHIYIWHRGPGGLAAWRSSDCRRTTTNTDGEEVATMVTITVSRESGSGGAEVARVVAERLGANYVDRELIEMGFKAAGLPLPAPAPTAQPKLPEKEAPGLGRRIAAAIAGTFAGGLQPWPRPLPERPRRVGEEDSYLRDALPSDSAYVAAMRTVFEQLLQEGHNLVVIGRGGQCLLAGRPHTVHVHICAPLATRVQRVMAEEGLSAEAAAELVYTQDRERANYIRRYYNVDWLQPSLYHLTLNTGWLSRDQAVELILRTTEMVG